MNAEFLLEHLFLGFLSTGIQTLLPSGSSACKLKPVHYLVHHVLVVVKPHLITCCNFKLALPVGGTAFLNTKLHEEVLGLGNKVGFKKFWALWAWYKILLRCSCILTQHILHVYICVVTCVATCSFLTWTIHLSPQYVTQHVLSLQYFLINSSMLHQ